MHLRGADVVIAARDGQTDRSVVLLLYAVYRILVCGIKITQLNTIKNDIIVVVVAIIITLGQGLMSVAICFSYLCPFSLLAHLCICRQCICTNLLRFFHPQYQNKTNDLIFRLSLILHIQDRRQNMPEQL